ncbi:class I adenylate-forming enzyme family protein [Sabulicella rubraurantiaca]|uniref:class I adenylate-forming enzyme family protein n=1 Tax=Sabulicella rubraurantiaca TaxID=2811429 RepID=UPI001A971108|nr:class I adenylate-forming enzyme family protein [Sabulicella rubraurantiaca]
MTGFAARNLGALAPSGLDPDKPALIFRDGGVRRVITHGAFDALANAAARGLIRRGLKRGERIGLLAANSIEFLALLCGAMRAGLVAVPVNWRFPPETVAYVLENAGVALVAHDAARADAVPAGLPRLALDGPDWDSFLDPGPFEAIEPAEKEPALFLYTSGSTGRPKGVVLSHQSHLWIVEQRLKGAALGEERFLIAAPLYHMNGLALAQLALAAGATIVLLPQFREAEYITAVGEERCTWLTAVPPMFAMLLREQELLARTDTGSVRSIRLGSAPVSEALAAAILRAFPSARLINAYGTTEAGPVVFGPHPEGKPTPRLSVGYPHPAVTLRLRAADGTLGDEGVLEQKTPGLMNGYYARPDLKPPVTEDGFYVTGDVMRRDADGFHYVIGRADDMFISGGENIFPGEVEAVLERHPGVEQAAVLPVPDDIKGTKPVAFVVPRGEATPTEADLKAFTLAHAPAFMHPRRIWFLPALPLMGTNKVDKARLREMALERMVV